MLVYVGQTRSRRLIAKLVELGIGECTNRGEYPPRRSPWFLDNGAFSDWRSGRDFDDEEFWFELILALASSNPPAFVVCPDRVATGLASLAFSLRWLDECESRLRVLGEHVELAVPRWYFVTQDGMTADDVRAVAPRFAGLFVGGSLPWKLQTGAAWVQLAHELEMPCHIGRVGTVKRVRWAQRIGADSIDSSLPLWSSAKLDGFVAALERRQGELAL